MHGAERVVHFLLERTMFISKENLELKTELPDMKIYYK